jgi:hypothetical protein
MGQRGVGGGVGAGCGAFGLLGLLVGVGLVVWLGSEAFDRTADAPRSVQQAEELDLTVPSPEAAGSLRVEPTSGLVDGGIVAITGEGLDPGPATLTICLAFQTRAAGTEGACDRSTDVLVDVGADGTVAAELTVRRVLWVLGAPYDCAAFPGACTVIVHTDGSLTGAPDAPLGLAANLPPVEATVPPGG